MRGWLSVEAGVGLALAAAFVLRYLAVPGWWQSKAGRHMMVATVILGLLFGLLLTGPWPLPMWVAAVGALDAVLAGQLLLLLLLQRAERRARDQRARVDLPDPPPDLRRR